MTPAAWRTTAAADFAHQLVLQQQRRLFEHWLDMGDNGGVWQAGAWPARNGIRPAAIRDLLANVLIIEPRPMPQGLRVRLAGSGLWEIHGGEITGQTLHEGFGSRHGGHWRRIHERLLEHPLPDCGHLIDQSRMNIVFWLRLPISAEKGGAPWLLGLDIALPISKAGGLVDMEEMEERISLSPAEEAAHGGGDAA